MSSFAMNNNLTAVTVRSSSKNNISQPTLQSSDIKTTINNSIQLDNIEQNSQLIMIRKAHRSIGQLKQCKQKLHQLQSILTNIITPQRQYLIHQLLSKDTQIIHLSHLAHIKRNQHMKMKQSILSISKQIQQQQKHFIQTIQHKQEVNESITRVQNQINHLQNIYNEMLVIKKTKQQQVVTDESSKWRQQQIAYQKGQQQQPTMSSNRNNLEQQLHYATQFNTQLRDCLQKRLAVKNNLEQSLNEKMQEISYQQQQSSHLNDQLLDLEQRHIVINQQHQQVSHEQQSQQNQLVVIQMQNTQLKARLQILKHTLNEQTQLTRQLQNEIQHKQHLSQLYVEDDQQTNLILQRLLRIKLEAEYTLSRAKTSNNSFYDHNYSQ